MIAFEATKRGLTDRETTMEDTHAWVVNADGSGRREIGAGIDNRQGPPEWAPDSSALMITVQERGNTRLYRVPLSCSAGLPSARVSGGAACPGEPMITERGAVGAFSIDEGSLAYTFATPSDQAELYVRVGTSSPRRLTDLNATLLGWQTARGSRGVHLHFERQQIRGRGVSHQTGRLTVGRSVRISRGTYPLIVNIHGGPHGQQGPAFNFKNQVYAARGWATLMVNYRGSTGYGQAFTDAVFADQNGNEGQDVLYGVSAALRRYPWIDRDRLGVEGTSYGGQLSTWLITQTNIFKAAIPTAAITNIISYNYMTYYNQYEAMEWGIYPHQGTLMDTLLQRSALRHVANAHTPTMLMHGENDNDVPIAEAEQFYVALKDVGTEAVMVRYPREGHGVRESRHVVDQIDRSISWYKSIFQRIRSRSGRATSRRNRFCDLSGCVEEVDFRRSVLVDAEQQARLAVRVAQRDLGRAALILAGEHARFAAEGAGVDQFLPHLRAFRVGFRVVQADGDPERRLGPIGDGQSRLALPAGL